MKKFRTYYSLPLILFLFFLLTACSDENNKEGGPEGPQQTPMLPVVEVPSKTITSYTTYPTSIEGIVNSAVYAKVSGYITNVYVDEGEKVSKGQTLFKLETESLSQDASAARAKIDAAQVEVDKLTPLVQEEIIGHSQLETAKAELQEAKSTFNSIAANIGYATIKSPVDGYVGAINLRSGALVSPSSQMPLTTVSDISEVYAYFSMNERNYLNFIQKAEGSSVEEKIKNLPKVQLMLANDSIYKNEGRIETINSQINDNTGSISFRALFVNQSRVLTNGSSGKIRVPKTYNDAVVVPVPSTYSEQGSIYVYLVGKDSTAVARRIIITEEVENMYVVSKGLKKGDKIIAKGLDKIKGKTKIKPQEIPFDSIAKPVDQLFRETQKK